MEDIGVMDIVSSTAAVLQLLGQAVSLVQQLYSARQAVKAAPKQLADTEDQLFTLTETIEQVREEKELHTPAIQVQLDLIRDISKELTMVLSVMKALQERNKIYQGLCMLVKKNKYEGKLNEVMDRLDRAKAELGIRIYVVHVSLTRRVGMGIERIEEGIMARDSDRPAHTRGEGQRKEGVERLEEGMVVRDPDRPVHEREEDQRKEGVKKTKKRGRGGIQTERERDSKRDLSIRFYHDLRVDDNLVEDDGTQMNGIVGFGEEKTVTPSRASVVGNRASGKGQQRNFILGSGGFAELRACGFGT